ncbi:MAG TPA: recombinase family protein [Candidatus Limnocylindrales bacterium]|nr:recombinase family protein [Candidatus Limnocylindrales bacterium]
MAPYGYRLADVGPHFNRAHAAWGRRLHRLEPNPQTAPWARWIFARRLEGHSIAGIARMLNETGMPSPSGFDRERNRHRPGYAWHLRSVATILAKPRYTGRQVWNRQQTKRRPTEDALPGMAGVRKLAPSQGWAISDKPAHEALVSEADFIAAQNVSAQNQPVDGSSRTNLLVGMLRCGIFGRSMQSQLSHGNAACRCRHGDTSAHPAALRQARNLYLREDLILGRVLAELHTITSRDTGISAEIARLQDNRNAADAVKFVRTHNITIECHAAGLSLQPDHKKPIIISSLANASEREERIPRQRTPWRKQKRDIAER